MSVPIAPASTQRSALIARAQFQPGPLTRVALTELDPRGEFYIVERDETEKVLSTFDADDELKPADSRLAH